MIHIRQKARGATWQATAGHTALWHAITTEADGAPEWRKSVCGFKPNRAWAEECGETVTCPRCAAGLDDAS